MGEESFNIPLLTIVISVQIVFVQIIPVRRIVSYCVESASNPLI